MTEYNKNNPLRCFFAFEGYNSQGLALNRLKEHYPNFDWTCVGRSEIDRYAILAADALFPEAKDRNYGDISKIDWTDVPDIDLFTYSFPCTDISSAGKQEGLAEGSGTRSSLLWECRKAIESKRPRYLLMENVKNLVSRKFMPLFREWERYLAGLGYINFYKVMNAKDYGVPQNRERVFLVSVLDEDAAFHFPESFTLERKLKDVLEKDVDERYYLKKGTLEFLLKHSMRHYREGNGIESRLLCKDSDIAHTVTTYTRTAVTDNMIAEPAIIQKGRGFNKGGIHNECPAVTSNSFECNNMVIEPCALTPRRNEYGKAVRKRYETGKINESRHNMTDLVPRADGIANTLTSVQKDNLILVPRIMEVCNINPSGHGLNGRVVSAEGLAPTLSTNKGEGMKVLLLNGLAYRIRKLTPRECFRLMDMSEENIDRIQKSGISNSQQYRMAGNSIVVACLYYIFRNLFIDTRKEGVLF